MATAGRPVTGQAAAASAECSDPSIEPCPPCCPPSFHLDTALLALKPSTGTTILRPSFAVQPVNGGGAIDKTSTTTMVLAVGAVLAAGGVAWWLLRGKRQRRR